jgi:signal transduction histidine kinase
VDLAEVVRDVAAQFEAQAAKVGCALTVEPGGSAQGHWDRGRLEQVVANLLSNALKYGPGNPVYLRVDEHGGFARLTVRDEGIGIAPEALKRIWGKFERAVSDRHYGGLGLGLYITRQVVEAMSGRISVHSEPGQGATFVVELPHAPAALPAPPQEARPAPPDAEGSTA